MKMKRKYILVMSFICMMLLLALPNEIYAAGKVSISRTKMTLVVGTQKKLKIRNTKKTVKWSSSRRSVAKVNAQGMVTAGKEGTAVITAKVGKRKYTCKVTVKEKPSLKKSETICVGKKVALTVAGTAKTVKWSSSNKQVVKVNQKGVIRGIKKGTAVITAKVDGQKLKCKVRVKDAVKNAVGTLSIENSGSLVLIYHSDSISCKSSNTEVVTVHVTEQGPAEDGPGQEAVLAVYGHKNGTAIITVSNNCNKKKVQFPVKVQKQEHAAGVEKLKDYLVNHGKLDADGNKRITVSADGGRKMAAVTYDFWEDFVDFEYTEINENGKVQWTILGPNDPEDQYMVMWITQPGAKESQYVTVKQKIADYKGENLLFEDTWSGNPVSTDLQKIANASARNAVEMLDSFLINSVGVTLKDTLK